MEKVMKEHETARGPSLIDSHRSKISEQKEEKKKKKAEKGGGKYDWNRERDLDSGRKVDKNLLGMVLGGAKKELGEKFHGSMSKSFM
jgi:hypothetical protein